MEVWMLIHSQDCHSMKCHRARMPTTQGRFDKYATGRASMSWDDMKLDVTRQDGMGKDTTRQGGDEQGYYVAERYAQS